ncbi:hemagglutinin, partial [Neisseria meningitidis]|uniref:hemagglutinin repeat-containing protein n=1 Tax=Neisseria meningitidis TaxID=487 RepID=UPI001C5709EF
ITHRHSHIGDKGSQTLIQSGGDTTIKGAQVRGKGVQVNAKNLSIQSVQDRETYQSKQQNASAQVTVGYGFSAGGDYSQSKIRADHVSVTEQSGIYAGEDGYQIKVGNHTDLKGGIITSSQSAEDKGKNRFQTATLTASDIQNHSQYEGKSFGLGASVAVSGKTLGQGAQNKPQNKHLTSVADKNGASSSVGYGSDQDSQSSITKSGINTRNIHITDEAAQIRLTGKTAAQTKADIGTNVTTDTAERHSGSLKNTFNKEAVQSELDLQRTVSQDFSKNVQQANTEINQHLDKLKADKEAAEALANGDMETAKRKVHEAQDAAAKADNWQQGKVILNMLASGLAAPTQSGAGIAAATASPAVSYAIGQHFKDLAGQNANGKLTASQETAHVLAHAVLGAAVAAAGGNNALAGALSAGGSEAAAPYISKWLYGKGDGGSLNAEEKETVSAITSLLGTATGAAIGDTTTNAAQGSLNAQSAVENNNGARRARNSRNLFWTEAQNAQNELNAMRINALTQSIRRIEPNFRGIPSLRDPNRPIPNEEVREYENYSNRISPKQPITLLNSSSTILGTRQNIRENFNQALDNLSRDNTLNELGKGFNARQRVGGNLDASNINLQIGFKTIRPNSSASKNGMPIYSNVSRREIFDLYEKYSGQRPDFRNIPSKGQLSSTTITSGPWKGTTIILRNFSTSREQTGAKWTIEFRNQPDSVRGQRLELKFR